MIHTERKRLRHMFVTGFFALFLLIGVLGGWAALASIQGAIVSHGYLAQGGKNKLVQHDETGIVKKIHIIEGQLVKSGDLLITLDGTRVHSEREILNKRLFEASVKKARLEAIRDGKQRFHLPATLALQSGAHKAFRGLVDVQLKLFKATVEQKKSKENQLLE